MMTSPWFYVILRLLRCQGFTQRRRPKWESSCRKHQNRAYRTELPV